MIEEKKANSRLVRQIRAALGSLQADGAPTLRVSVSNSPHWEENGDHKVRVRWMCWSIDVGDEEVVPPEFEVLSPHVTQAMLAKELPELFEGVEVIVDDDIDL